MEKGKKKVLLLGIGYFEKELLKAIAQRWDTIAVDMNEEKENDWGQVYTFHKETFILSRV
ncbi:MAG: hypothetical protein V2A69_02700 [Pseudomonadota bacterium]